MDNRLSPKSDSSVEPMDISAKTVSDMSIGSVAPPTKEHGESEENCESDERADNDDGDAEDRDDSSNTISTTNTNIVNITNPIDTNNKAIVDNSKHTRKLRHVVRRENLRQLDNNMIMRKKGRFANNYRINKTNGNSYDKDNGSADDSNKYCCPICGVNSPTQHEFTEHIRGHNNADGNQNFTCQICFKVCNIYSYIYIYTLMIYIFIEMKIFRA